MKVFLVTEGDGKEDDNVYVSGLEPWHIEKVIEKIASTGANIGKLDDPELWSGVRGLIMGQRCVSRRVWSLYYVAAEEHVSMMPSPGEAVDITKEAMVCIGALKGLLPTSNSDVPCEAETSIISMERNVGLFASDKPIHRPHLPMGMRAAVIVNTSDGYVDIHRFGTTPDRFHCHLLAASLFGHLGVTRGNEWRARCYQRPSVMDICRSFTALIACGHSNAEARSINQ